MESWFQCNSPAYVRRSDGSWTRCTIREVRTDVNVAVVTWIENGANKAKVVDMLHDLKHA